MNVTLKKLLKDYLELKNLLAYCLDKTLSLKNITKDELNKLIDVSKKLSRERKDELGMSETEFSKIKNTLGPFEASEFYTVRMKIEALIDATPFTEFKLGDLKRLLKVEEEQLDVFPGTEDISKFIIARDSFQKNKELLHIKFELDFAKNSHNAIWADHVKLQKALLGYKKLGLKKDEIAKMISILFEERLKSRSDLKEAKLFRLKNDEPNFFKILSMIKR